MNVLGENINPDCIDDTFTQVNATGHLVVPGFIGPIGHNSISNPTLTPESNWTINTAITEILYVTLEATIFCRDQTRMRCLLELDLEMLQTAQTPDANPHGIRGSKTGIGNPSCS